MLSEKKIIPQKVESQNQREKLIETMLDYKNQFEKFLNDYYEDPTKILTPEFYHHKIVRIKRKDSGGVASYDYDIPEEYQSAYFSKFRENWFSYIKLLGASFLKVYRSTEIRKKITNLFAKLSEHDRKYHVIKKGFEELTVGKRATTPKAFKTEWKKFQELDVYKDYLSERKKLIKQANDLLEQIILKIDNFIKINKD